MPQRGETTADQIAMQEQAGCKVLKFGVAQARLRELLQYDPESGSFIWLQNASNRAPQGSKAGCYSKAGNRYVVLISIDGRLFLAHRLAWFYMHGEWPKNEIGHVDGNPCNNSWANLKEATRSENMRKARLRADNGTGEKGIVLYPKRGLPYRVWRSGKYIGCFATLDEAKAARARAAGAVNLTS